MDIPGRRDNPTLNAHNNNSVSYNHGASPPYYLGTSPGSTTSHRNSAGSQQYYPQSPPNYNIGNSPLGKPGSESVGGSVVGNRTSGGSGTGYRPPSVQSGGYRLAKSLEDSEGYLEPRASANSYQLNRLQPHDSGVDIDQSRESSSNLRLSGSDQSSNSVISFQPNGAIGWTPNEKPGKEANLHKDMTKHARPDSLAYRHEYEELPLKYPHAVSTKSQYGYADVDENALSNTSTVRQSIESKPVSGDFSQPGFRRRQNPLYDAVVREESRLSGKPAAGGCPRCMCVAVVLFTILSTIALVIACVAIARVAMLSQEPRSVYEGTTPASSQLQEANERIAQLERKYEDLLNKYLILHQVIGVNDSKLDYTLKDQLSHQGELLVALGKSTNTNNKQLEGLTNQVELLQNDTQSISHRLEYEISKLEDSDVAIVMSKLTNHSAQISQLTSSVDQIGSSFQSFKTEIQMIAQNISKMPGPVGRPGAGNLSLCEHKFVNQGFGLGINEFSTKLVPDTADNSNYVILGIECSSNTTYNWLAVNSSAGFDQFKCSCSGDSHPIQQTNRHCTMNYWRCPRLS